MSALRDILLVAGFDLVESLRSRKALALLLLYLAGSIGAALIFVEALGAVENRVAESLAVAETERPGAMTGELMESEQFLDIVAELIGDRELAQELVTIPPLALFYGWMALTFVPVLVTLSSAESIASEVASGSARFALFRTDRRAWALGKLAGQAALMAVGIAAGALGVLVVGVTSLTDLAVGPTAWWLLRLSGRAWLYGFPWLGLALGVSQVTRSVPWSRGLALLGLFGLGMLGAVSEAPWVREKAPVVVDTVAQLFPRTYRVDLWQPELTDRLPSVVMLLALGGLFFAAGHLVFTRRDA